MQATKNLGKFVPDSMGNELFISSSSDLYYDAACS